MTGDRRTVWFPLAVLGFVLFGLGMLFVKDETGWFRYAPLSAGGVPLPQQNLVGFGDSRAVAVQYGGPGALSSNLESAWLIAVAVAFVTTVIFYAVRARRTGRAIGWPKLAGIVLAGAALLLLGSVLAGSGTTSDRRAIATAVGWPLAVLGLCAGAWGYFDNARGRKAALVLAAVCLPVAPLILVSAAGAAVVFAATAGLGLAVLAWLSRSVLLAVVVVLFLGGALVFDGGVRGALVPAAVLLAGAIAVLVSGRRPTATST
ncbi:hypothetical protein [Amycolatopsis sp.]|uniref:hypothetical protein n=1 Tax=Amycolatopsis sp. TaxID=37632 RepID=UPI002BC22F3F|nr:hypothetical protein [Amycolatopsis sp.]HVV10361.1 hypothetical protein [Amycolatopsis sp.]